MSSSSAHVTMARVLFVAGYPVAVVILARWVPVVRERRLRWFVVHQAAVVAIVAGWLLVGRRAGAAVNGAWLAVAAAWYARGAALAPR